MSERLVGTRHAVSVETPSASLVPLNQEGQFNISYFAVIWRTRRAVSLWCVVLHFCAELAATHLAAGLCTATALCRKDEVQENERQSLRKRLSLR